MRSIPPYASPRPFLVHHFRVRRAGHFRGLCAAKNQLECSIAAWRITGVSRAKMIRPPKWPSYAGTAGLSKGWLADAAHYGSFEARRGAVLTAARGNSTHRKANVRRAIYTRKSSEEGLDQEFNSLKAQREACEAFINSQRHQGRVRLPACYDDGGFSGATMERPVLQRLLSDITAGRVDIVVVYKIDRVMCRFHLR
jgi:hypothetical protein